MSPTLKHPQAFGWPRSFLTTGNEARAILSAKGKGGAKSGQDCPRAIASETSSPARQAIFGSAASTQLQSRAAAAGTRCLQATASLENCHLCEHHCGVNRLAGQHGRCHAGPRARVFSAQVEIGDESDLIPTFAVAFSGCDLRCGFCISAEESWNPGAGEIAGIPRLAMQAKNALAQGARSVMLLGGEPTVHLPTALEFIAALPEKAPVVWKTNAHFSHEARALLEGLIDVWLPDFKFGNDACASQLAGLPDYSRVVKDNLRWMHRQCAQVNPVPDGLEAQTAIPEKRRPRLIVRHLLLPGHVECCWAPLAEWLAAELPDVQISAQNGFWPQRVGGPNLGLQRTISRSEWEQAQEIAQNQGLNLVQ